MKGVQKESSTQEQGLSPTEGSGAGQRLASVNGRRFCSCVVLDASFDERKRMSD